MTDETLAARAKKGDDKAFYALIQTYKKPLYKTALAYLKNEADALEAIQEITFRAYKSIKKLKEPRYAKTWLTRIMINYCADELKRRKRTISGETESGATENDESIRLIMEEGISKLNPNYQNVIILKYFQDLTLTEIAITLDKPEGTVKTWLHKALTELRKQWEKEEGEYGV